MLTDVVRKSLDRISNRFELVVLTSERCRQLLGGARAVVDNPSRERLMKVAMREIVDGHVVREGDHWRVDRPVLPDIFVPPPSTVDEEVMRLRDDSEDEEE